MSFRPLHVPVNFLIQGVRFRKFFDSMILRSISEESIWFPTVMFITLILELHELKGDLLCTSFLDFS